MDLARDPTDQAIYKKYLVTEWCTTMRFVRVAMQGTWQTDLPATRVVGHLRRSRDHSLCLMKGQAHGQTELTNKQHLVAATRLCLRLKTWSRPNLG